MLSAVKFSWAVGEALGAQSGHGMWVGESMTDTSACGRGHLRQAGLAAQRGERGAAMRMLSLVAGMPPTCTIPNASALTWCNTLSATHLKPAQCILHAWAAQMRIHHRCDEVCFCLAWGVGQQGFTER